MYIYRCGEVDHPAGQVYSVDLHPDGDLLATAGFNDRGKGCLIVWDLTAVVGCSKDLAQGEEAKEDEEKSKKRSAKLDEKAHMNRQNCVRWSRVDRGRYLVATGDNSIVHLYEPFNDTDKSNFDLKDALQLIGHKSEVIHAEFSRDGKFLASCSLDSSVIIWDMKNLTKPLRILTSEDGGHSDYVRGLVWDPLERFLITQSSDQTIKVWRHGNWECEQTITGFSNLSKFYSRMDWTADGSMLVAPCSGNNGFNTAKIILRKQWMAELDLVGFDGATSCVRGSTRCNIITVNDKKLVGSLIAVGSQDRSVSIWMLPVYQRPLVVIQEILPEEILDLSWHDEKLVVCGINGSVRCIILEESETGRFLSDREMAEQYSKSFSYVPSVYREREDDVDYGTVNVKDDEKSIWDEFDVPTEEMCQLAKDCDNYFLPHTLMRSCNQCLTIIRGSKCRYPEPEIEVIGDED
ncbi:unnamed protein product [Bursaphelenchus okinawaensis]|uniref:WD_REPEATS_REGION domain-containing protein n=1 Tax=Bursaphelenchus okinawaensis TaxID=465554 RepID=A0A811LKS4_9BILA|nr:unnamed protein product [Bursaphelenchus okinawaensis]CAG9123529.1 unnamed protein product [Bursaphelenchus okinawaensis]